MANPYTPGTEAYKLYEYAFTTKGNSDKAAKQFAEANRGKGLFDVSGANATPNLTLARSSATAHGSVGR